MIGTTVPVGTASPTLQQCPLGYQATAGLPRNCRGYPTQLGLANCVAHRTALPTGQRCERTAVAIGELRPTITRDAPIPMTFPHDPVMGQPQGRGLSR
jgi:hypothetical protein